MVVHTFNPGTREAETEADGSKWIQGQSDLHSKFQSS